MAVTAPAPRVLADVLPRSIARDAMLIVGAAVVGCVFAQIAIPLPFTPVPLTGRTFAVLRGGAALRCRRSRAQQRHQWPLQHNQQSQHQVGPIPQLGQFPTL